MVDDAYLSDRNAIHISNTSSGTGNGTSSSLSAHPTLTVNCANVRHQ